MQKLVMIIRHAVDIHYAWNYNRDSKIVHNLSNIYTQDPP